MKLKSIFAVLTAVAMLSACSGKKDIPGEQMPIGDIYDSAYALLDKKKYEQASTEFLEVERVYPASIYAADALTMAAYSAYLDNDFAGALMITDRFMRFHPGHSDMEYIMYLRAMCYYRQVSDVRREPGMSVYALGAFEVLNMRFPKSPYYSNAENKIKILKNYIAGKMMHSARDDMKKQNWTSAIDRLQSVVTGAQTTVMVPEALFRLTECYTAIGLPEQAKGYADMLRLNYPDNEWTKKLK